ncbi:arginyltransferase [Agarilytica rhodophyticola]|uniref:arginyltransferase n=1 Tax=Agarilytica rhodophyticola TaxID=1737490 RepID=UPI000B349875|nr:arginyltransferase [Agarilytica rhodophyticola]
MTDLSELKLYATKPHPCSYLPGKDATTIFIDPDADMNGDIFSQLSELGFRRSGHHVYRPKCQDCRACVPIRIPVEEFKMSRSQKRCIKANRDVQTLIVDNIDTEEHYQLYANYIEQRHADGDMYPPSVQQYRDFLTSEWGITRYLEFRIENRLIAVSVCDLLDNGISAIYAFFDPNETKRSLGVFNILFQTQWAKELKLPFVYLGYWISKCKKMSYKVEYRPFQVLIENRWVVVKDYKS